MKGLKNFFGPDTDCGKDAMRLLQRMFNMSLAVMQCIQYS